MLHSESDLFSNSEIPETKIEATILPTSFLIFGVVLATVLITYWDLSQYFQLPEELGVLNFSYLYDPLLSGTFQNLQVAADPSSLAAIPWSILSLILGMFDTPSGATYLVLQCVLRVSLVLSLIIFFKTFVTTSRTLSVCGAFIFLSSLTGYYTSIYTTRISSVIIFSLVLTTFTARPKKSKVVQEFVFTRLLIMIILLPGLLTNLGHFLATTLILVFTFFIFRDQFTSPLKFINRKKMILLIFVSLCLLFFIVKTYFVESILVSFGQYRESIPTFSSGRLTEIVQGRGAWWEEGYLRWGDGLERLLVQICRLLIFIFPFIYMTIQTTVYLRKGLRPHRLSVYLVYRVVPILAFIGAYKIDRNIFASSDKFFSMTNWMHLISSNKFEIGLLFLLCGSIGSVFVFGSLIRRSLPHNQIDDDSKIIQLLFLSSFLIFGVWATPTDKLVLLSSFLGMFRETWAKFGGFMYVFVVASFLATSGALQQRMPRYSRSIKTFIVAISLVLVLLPLFGKSSYRLRDDKMILDVNSIAIVDQIGRTARTANGSISTGNYLGFCLIPRYSIGSPAAVGIVRVLAPLLVNKPVLSQVTGDYGLELLQMGIRSSNCNTDPNYLGICIYDRTEIELIEIPSSCELSFPIKHVEI